MAPPGEPRRLAAASRHFHLHSRPVLADYAPGGGCQRPAAGVSPDEILHPGRPHIQGRSFLTQFVQK